MLYTALAMLPVLALALLVAMEQAPRPRAPDFSASTIVVEPAPPLEGDLVTLNLTVRNSGGEAASHADVDLQLPGAGMFVDAAGPSNAIVDLDARVISWQIAIDAGATQAHTVRLILPRRAAGEVLLPTMRVRQLYTGTEAWIHGQADVQTRPDPSGAATGGLRIAPAGLAVIALLAAAISTWGILRVLAGDTRSGLGATAAVVAIAIAVGFWALFASMARHDWRVLAEYVAADCRVLDRRMRTSTTTGPAERRLVPPQRPTTTYRPLLALQYNVNGSTVISTGFDAGSRVQIGSGAREIESFARWPVGSTVPCWYDPRDPAQVVVLRGFGGAYLFALPITVVSSWDMDGSPHSPLTEVTDDS